MKLTSTEKEFGQARKDIKRIYEDMELAAKMNPDLYLMPVELYNRIMKKIEYLDDKLRSQTNSLKRHLKEKQELRKKLKKLEK